MKDIKDIRITNVPVVDFDELECIFEKPKSEYAFYDRADQYEGYFWFGTDEDDLAYCRQEIQEYEDIMTQSSSLDYPAYSAYIWRLKNDLELIQSLRAAGYDDGVLIQVWW